MKAVSGNVTGRVQGVGFRYFTRTTAARLGIKGWVKNLAGGSVAFFAQGSAPVVDQFVEKIKDGPSFAAVDQCDTVPEEPDNRLSDFTIR